MESKESWKSEGAKSSQNNSIRCVHCDLGFVNDARCHCKGMGLVNDACVCKRMYGRDVEASKMLNK
jgi:hypothetical protein